MSLTFGALGMLELLAVYLAVRTRLPPTMAWHYGPTGQPSDSVAPGFVLGFELAVLGTTTLAFAAVLRWGARSAPLVTHLRGRFTGPLLALQAFVGVALLPFVFGLLFVQAAGAATGHDLGIEILLTLIGALSAPVILGVALLVTRRDARQLPPVPVAGPTVHERLAVGGPVEVLCSACGEPFRISGVPLLAPHAGFGRTGSLYLRCPRCGERGWDPIVGRVVG